MILLRRSLYLGACDGVENGGKVGGLIDPGAEGPCIWTHFRNGDEIFQLGRRYCKGNQDIASL